MQQGVKARQDLWDSKLTRIGQGWGTRWAATAAVYLSKHCVFTQQPFDGVFIELVVQVFERCVNAIAVQLITAVGQYHCLQPVTALFHNPKSV